MIRGQIWIISYNGIPEKSSNQMNTLPRSSSWLCLTLSSKPIVTNIINDITYYINYHTSVYNRNMSAFQFRNNILNISIKCQHREPFDIIWQIIAVNPSMARSSQICNLISETIKATLDILGAIGYTINGLNDH